jgi:hypothetical protein
LADKSVSWALYRLRGPLFDFLKSYQSGKKKRLQRDAFRYPDTLGPAYTEMRALSQSSATKKRQILPLLRATIDSFTANTVDNHMMGRSSHAAVTLHQPLIK